MQFPPAFQLVQRKKTESVLTEIDQRAFSLCMLLYSLLRPCRKTELRWGLCCFVKTPIPCMHIRCPRLVGSFSGFVDPFLIFEGRSPGFIGIHILALDIQGRHLCLVVHFNVYLLLSFVEFNTTWHSG